WAQRSPLCGSTSNGLEGNPRKGGLKVAQNDRPPCGGGVRRGFPYGTPHSGPGPNHFEHLKKPIGRMGLRKELGAARLLSRWWGESRRRHHREERDAPSSPPLIGNSEKPVRFD